MVNDGVITVEQAAGWLSFAFVFTVAMLVGAFVEWRDGRRQKRGGGKS